MFYTLNNILKNYFFLLKIRKLKNISNSKLSIEDIKNLCTSLSEKMAIPFRANPAYEEYLHIQKLYDYDIKTFKKTLSLITNKTLLTKCGLSSIMFSNFLRDSNVENITYNFGINSTRYTHVIVIFKINDKLYPIDPHLNCMFYDINSNYCPLDKLLDFKNIKILPNVKNFYKSIINTEENINIFCKQYNLRKDFNLHFVDNLLLNNVKLEHYKFECDENFLEKYYLNLKKNFFKILNTHPI